MSMEPTVQEWSQRALRQRLQDAPYDWKDEQDSPESQWLSWAIVRDAAKLLSKLRVPNYLAFQKQMRGTAPGSTLQQPDFDAAETFFLKVAMVIATQRLVRMPEYGPIWNSLQAQRLEIRQQVEWLEQHGQKDAARQMLEKMPKAVTRAAIAQRRKLRDDEAEKVAAPTPEVTPATTQAPPAQQRESGGGMRP